MSIYSRGIEVGEIKQQTANILELLRFRGTVSEELEQRILTENNRDTLKEWFHIAVGSASVEEFRKKIESIQK
jgi:hypothetical protein